MDPFEKEYKNQFKRNIDDVLNEINQPNMQEKIKNHAEKFGLDPKELTNEITQSRNLRSFFAKDPAKQNIYNREAGKRLKQKFPSTEIKLLPHNGQDTIYIKQGIISHGFVEDGIRLDFSWRNNDYTVYARQFYIGTEGGSQQRSFDFVKKCIENCMDNSTEIFMILCDGAFFTESRMNELIDYSQRPNIIVCHIEEIDKFLKEN